MVSWRLAEKAILHMPANAVNIAVGILTSLSGLALSGSVSAQNRFPSCTMDRSYYTWHECNGGVLYSNGYRYYGEWKYGRRNGLGILYNSSNSIVSMGLWQDDHYSQEVRVNPPARGILFQRANSEPPAPASRAIMPTVPPPMSSPQTKSTKSSGSAFRIAVGQFITNNHVIERCSAIKVAGGLDGRVLAVDPIRDLAIVAVTNDRGAIASVRNTRIRLNESITVAGFPMDGAFSGIAITTGTVSRLSGLNGDTGEVQISAPVQPGNSGGPLLDSAGNVIGVVSSKLNALKVAGISGDIPQNVNFAISGNALRGFLDSKNINYREVGNERDLNGVQIAAEASSFTVLIECQR